MRHATTLGGAVVFATMLWGTTAASAAGPFDGAWNVDIVCADASDGAAGYELRFAAQVRDGAVFGQFSSTQTSAVATLRGQIQPNGEALLQVDGRTGPPVYSVGRTAPGTPYHYTAAARFSGSSGSGRRNELRACNLSFNRT